MCQTHLNLHRPIPKHHDPPDSLQDCQYLDLYHQPGVYRFCYMQKKPRQQRLVIPFLFLSYFQFFEKRYGIFIPLLISIFTLFYIDTVKLHAEEHTSELQSRENLVCRLLLEKKKEKNKKRRTKDHLDTRTRETRN